MVALLLVDIGLAAAGGVLMSKGLAEREAKKVEPTPVEKKSEAPASVTPPAANKVDASSAVPAAAPAPGAAAAAAAAPAAAVAARESPTRAAASDPKLATASTSNAKVADAKSTAKATDTKNAKPTDTKSTAKATDTKSPKPTDKPDVAKPVGSVPTTPQDPYLAPNTEREIDAAAASSKAAFAKCAADHPAQGALKIAFQVRGDGRVINASAVENSTGNAELARCVSAEVSTWRVSAHDGAAINMLRPFTYP
jgi:coiled-coil-helix-coiled-coil-helix domain-containing protein 2